MQLPPVPEEASLLASPEGRSEVHKAGRAIFAQQDFVYRLDTMMRFSDETLIGILQKMRTPGGCNLTENEW